MKLKMQGELAAVSPEGLPIFVHEDGKEVAFDATAAVKKIKDLSDERDGLRTKVTEAVERLKPFEGLDPEQVRKDRETVQNLSDGKLLAAKEVDTLKQQISSGWREKLSEAEIKHRADVAERDAKIHDLTVGHAFASSKFIEKLTGVPEAHQALFGGNFKFEDGKVVGYLGGTKILSREKPGEPATFDEALQAMVDAHPRKAEFYKSPGKGGSDLPANNGAPVAGGRYTAEQVAGMDMATYQRERAAGNIQ